MLEDISSQKSLLLQFQKNTVSWRWSWGVQNRGCWSSYAARVAWTPSGASGCKSAGPVTEPCCVWVYRAELWDFLAARPGRNTAGARRSPSKAQLRLAIIGSHWRRPNLRRTIERAEQSVKCKVQTLRKRTMANLRRQGAGFLDGKGHQWWGKTGCAPRHRVLIIRRSHHSHTGKGCGAQIMIPVRLKNGVHIRLHC